MFINKYDDNTKSSIEADIILYDPFKELMEPSLKAIVYPY